MSLLSMFLACGSSEAPPGQAVFVSADATDSVTAWTVPSGVTSIHVLVVNGSDNAASSIKRGATVLIEGDSATGASIAGGNGGAHGAEGVGNTAGSIGGGGAGGYAGNGGNGGNSGKKGTVSATSGAAGAGGGGGGGGGGLSGGTGFAPGRGGGVGLLGLGTSGSGGAAGNTSTSGVAGGNGSDAGVGVYGAGIGNAAGGNLRYTITAIAVTPGEALTITAAKRGTATDAATGGAIRLMWGAGRSYPSNAGDAQ